MITTFEELRKVKDRLPNGSMQKIADELGINVETVRSYFGGTNYEEGGASGGIHFEKGGQGGVVKINDTTIYEEALKILGTEAAAS